MMSQTQLPPQETAVSTQSVQSGPCALRQTHRSEPETCPGGSAPVGEARILPLRADGEGVSPFIRHKLAQVEEHVEKLASKAAGTQVRQRDAPGLRRAEHVAHLAEHIIKGHRLLR